MKNGEHRWEVKGLRDLSQKASKMRQVLIFSRRPIIPNLLHKTKPAPSAEGVSDVALNVKGRETSLLSKATLSSLEEVMGRQPRQLRAMAEA